MKFINKRPKIWSHSLNSSWSDEQEQSQRTNSTLWEAWEGLLKTESLENRKESSIFTRESIFIL